MSWTSLCNHDELKEGEGKYVAIDGFYLGVFLNGGNVYVLDDVCPHAGGSLSAGTIEEGCVVCPLHNWAFHLANGEMRDSGGVKISTYPVRLLERAGFKTLVQADLPIY